MKVISGKSDYIWSYFAYVLKFGVNLLIFPLVLKLLSTTEFGLWVIFSSIGSIINLFDFGFSSTILRNMTYVWSGAQTLQAEGYVVETENTTRNDRLFILTFQTCRRIYLVIALISLLVSCSIGLAYIAYVTREIYKVEYIIAWIIYSISIGLNLYYAYWTVSLKSIGAIQQSQKAIVFSIAVQLIVSYIGLICGFGVIALSVAACLCGIVVRLISRMYFVKYSGITDIQRRYNQSISKSEISNTFKTMWFNAKRAGISSIATVSLSQSTTLICSAYLGMEVAGAYGLCLQLLNALSGVSQIYYQTTIPLLTQARHHGDLAKCKQLFSISTTIAYMLYVIGCIVIIIFGTPLLSLIGSQTKLDVMMFLIISFYLFGEMIYSMHASFISLENKLPFVPSVVVTTIVVIPLSILVSYLDLGIWWLLGVRCIVEMSYIFWKWPLEAHKQLNTTTWLMLCTGVKEISRLITNKLHKTLCIY